MNRNILFSAAAVALFGATAFGQTVLNPTNFPGVITSLGDNDGDTFVEYQIVSDLTLVANQTYILDRPTFVNSGATLTVPEGVIFRGNPRTSGSTFNAGVLVVTTEGFIDAQGSPANPIVFTTAARNDGNGLPLDTDQDGNADRWNTGDATNWIDSAPKSDPLDPIFPTVGSVTSIYEGQPATSLWGGLIVLGQAPTNASEAGFGLDFVEGLPTTVPGVVYGGTNPNDYSGILRYVSVRHGGTTIGAANEINGISLGGVGRATVVEFCEIYCNEDDGLEIFGGTVYTRNIIVTFVKDDMFDLDQGFVGVNQFWFGVVHPSSSFGDHGGEWDGDDSDEAADGSEVTFTFRPITCPTIYNMTLISEVGGNTDDAIRARTNFAGTICNTIIYGFSQGIRIDDSNDLTISSDGTTISALVSGTVLGTAVTSLDQFTAGKLVFQGVTLEDTGANTNWTDFSTNSPTNANGNYVVTIPNDTGITEPVSVTSVGGLNPKPFQQAPFIPPFALPFCAELPSHFFLENFGSRGAFTSSPLASLWTTGWTALNLDGILVNQ